MLALDAALCSFVQGTLLILWTLSVVSNKGHCLAVAQSLMTGGGPQVVFEMPATSLAQNCIKIDLMSKVPNMLGS